MPVCDGVPSLQWFLVPSLDSCSLESCRLLSCCPESRHVLCEQHSSASQLPGSQPGWLCYACGDEWVPGLQGDNSRLFLKTCPCGLIFFLAVVKLPSVYALPQSCLPVLLVSCSSWSPAPAARLLSRGVYLCPAELQSWTSCS